MYEDIIHRILAMIRVSLINPYIVYGSGWFEFILSNQLRSFALNNNSLSQLAIHSYSNAIELLPISLGLNAGFNNVDLLVSLRNSQPSIDKYVHLDYSNRKLSNRRKPQIIESAFMKRQLLITATEAATSILRIDDIHETKTQNK